MSERGRFLLPSTDRVAAKVMDGEAVIIDLESGVYYSLSDVGGRAWELMEAGCSLERIALVIHEESGVDLNRVTADIGTLFAQLKEERLVVDAGEGEEPSSIPPASGPGAREYATPALQVFRDMQDLLALDPPMPGLKDIPWN
ncbi:MAG: PqqD family protein [Vicinamibacterales bacterium]